MPLVKKRASSQTVTDDLKKIVNFTEDCRLLNDVEEHDRFYFFVINNLVQIENIFEIINNGKSVFVVK